MYLILLINCCPVISHTRQIARVSLSSIVVAGIAVMQGPWSKNLIGGRSAIGGSYQGGPGTCSLGII